MPNATLSTIALATSTLVAANLQAANYALQYASAADCALAADADELDPTTAMTAEAWVRPNYALASTGFYFVLSKNLGYTGWALLSFTGSQQAVFQVFNDDQDLDQSATSPTPLAEQEWVHLVGVFGGGDVRIYLNGALAASGPALQPLSPNGVDLFVGCSLFGSGTYWKGELDEIRVWNSARTQQQILDHMFAPATVSDPNLVAYWSLDEGNGSTSADLTGHGHTLSLAPSGTTAPTWNDVTVEFPVFFSGFESGTLFGWSAITP